MFSNYLWIFLLIMQFATTTPRPISQKRQEDAPTRYNYEAQHKPKHKQNNEQVISVRITSSIAVGRSGARTPIRSHSNYNQDILVTTMPSIIHTSKESSTETTKDDLESISTDIPPNLIGANIEFIKQLNAKKETKKQQNAEQLHPFQLSMKNQFIGETDHLFERSKSIGIDNADLNVRHNFHGSYQSPFLRNNQSDDSVAESSLKSYEIVDDENAEFDSIPLSSIVSPLLTVTHIPPNKVYIPTKREKYSELRNNTTLDTVVEPIPDINNDYDENVENVPLARSVPLSPSSYNFIQDQASKTLNERGDSLSLTTVSFNIVHDTAEQQNKQNTQPSNLITNSNQGHIDSHNKFYEPPQVYSQPAKIYGEPAKFYSEPAKIYGEPAKIYSEPAKIYSEPAKIYSEPAKFYSEPASLHLTDGNESKHLPWKTTVQSSIFTDTPWKSSQAGDISVLGTTPTMLNTAADDRIKSHGMMEHLPEKNYEVDEKISVITDGRSHGIQETSTEKCKQDNCKVGYVVEGRQYKKYRVEERTPDGFIVGEYGVVRNEDGALRGVRYTADSEASPRLIYDALMKFLQLK